MSLTLWDVTLPTTLPLVSAKLRTERPQPLCKYQQIVDGDIIPDFPSQLIKQGKFAKSVPHSWQVG